MTDITTTWDVQCSQGAWTLSGGALASGNDLATAAIISLFTDAEASADDELPDNSGDRRGWWGDSGDAVRMGSLLWTLARSKLTQSVANRARDYAKKCLAWMIDDKVAGAIDVTTTIVKPNQLRLQVVISHGNSQQLKLNFDWAWQDLH